MESMRINGVHDRVCSRACPWRTSELQSPDAAGTVVILCGHAVRPLEWNCLPKLLDQTIVGNAFYAQLVGPLEYDEHMIWR